MPDAETLLRELLAGVAAGFRVDVDRLYAPDARALVAFDEQDRRDVVDRAALTERFRAAGEGPLRVRVENLVVHRTDDPHVVIGEFDYVWCSADDDSGVRTGNVQVVEERDGQIAATRDYHDHPAIRAAHRSRSSGSQRSGSAMKTAPTPDSRSRE